MMEGLNVPLAEEVCTDRQPLHRETDTVRINGAARIHVLSGNAQITSYRNSCAHMPDSVTYVNSECVSEKNQ